ncbi:MAG: four helix bundle protein [Alkalimonas sp.]|nr:four helix bundle protein [Alkalimonas sp.]
MRPTWSIWTWVTINALTVANGKSIAGLLAEAPQLLRSGTSIGANVNEAQSGQSKADFIAKMSIASKEARETKYWLELLCEAGYLDNSKPHVVSLLMQSETLIKILTKIVKSSQASS